MTSALSARRPSAGAVPGRWGACLAVGTPPAASSSKIGRLGSPSLVVSLDGELFFQQFLRFAYQERVHGQLEPSAPHRQRAGCVVFRVTVRRVDPSDPFGQAAARLVDVT